MTDEMIKPGFYLPQPTDRGAVKREMRFKKFARETYLLSEKMKASESSEEKLTMIEEMAILEYAFYAEFVRGCENFTAALEYVYDCTELELQTMKDYLAEKLDPKAKTSAPATSETSEKP